MGGKVQRIPANSPSGVSNIFIQPNMEACYCFTVFQDLKVGNGGVLAHLSQRLTCEFIG